MLIIWSFEHFYFRGDTDVPSQTMTNISLWWLLRGPLLSLQWLHNGRDDVWNHQPHDCLLNSLFRRRSKKTSKLRVTGLCEGNSPMTGAFPPQMASNAENVSIWWRHHVVPHCWSRHISVDDRGPLDTICWQSTQMIGCQASSPSNGHQAIRSIHPGIMCVLCTCIRTF